MQVLNALFCIDQEGCGWSALPEHCGTRRTVYARLNR